MKMFESATYSCLVGGVVGTGGAGSVPGVGAGTGAGLGAATGAGWACVVAVGVWAVARMKSRTPRTTAPITMSISGFRTGPLGMGHIVLNVENIEALLPFYTGTLGFHLSDFTLRPFKAYFLHLNPRHHSFAMVETGRNSVHHLMMELYMLDDVGQAYDLAQGEDGRIATTLGRHSNDFMTSFYANSPSGFFVEYGWGGRSIDTKNWTPVEMTCGPSLWGHDRNWLSEDGRAQARQLRLKAAENGLREPVQVIDGNYTIAPGTCLWWDAARKG